MDSTLVNEILDAVLNMLNTQSMKVQNNIAFISMTRYSNIDRQTFHNLAFIVAELISSINKLDDPDSVLHDKVIQAQNLLFSVSAIRLAGE